MSNVLRPPPKQIHHCRCGKRVYSRRAEGQNDWVYATASGETIRDDRPIGLVTDPAGWWEKLASEDINTYSSLSAATALGYWSWLHIHDSNSSVPLSDRAAAKLPWCCNSPMWSSPDGWVCRITKRIFPYS